MRTRWLILALVFSGMVNVAAIGTIGYHWWKVRSAARPFSRSHRPMMRGPMHEALSLSPAQMQKLHEQRRQIVEDISKMRQGLTESRAHLMQLLRSPDPDSMAVEEILQEIASSQLAVERKVIQNILQMKEALTPEQREMLLQMIERRGKGDGMRPGLQHRMRRGRPGLGQEDKERINSNIVQVADIVFTEEAGMRVFASSMRYVHRATMVQTAPVVPALIIRKTKGGD